MKRNIIKLLFLIVSSITILYPQDLKEIFYYDDNPIRYMIAKMFLDGNLTREDKMFFISYGSAEIYIPFFFVAKHLKIDYQITYNLVSLMFFILCILYLSWNFRRDEKILNFVIPIMTLLGVICVKKGSIHWLISSTIFLSNLLSDSFSINRFFLIGLAYLISPTLILISLIFSAILLFQREKKKAVFLIAPFLMILPKTIMISEMTLNEIKDLISLDSISSREISEMTKPTIPVGFYAFIRFILVDYVDNKIFAIFIVYIISARAVFFTRQKITLIIFAIFYILVGTSILLFKMWAHGLDIAENIIISFFAVLFVSNPFRYGPIIISYLIAQSDNKHTDKIFSKIILLTFSIWAIMSLIKGKGELPDKIPQDVKELIEFLKNSKAQNILVEGDSHILKGWKIIHPLYDSHIISYIVAETEGKKFHGGLIPWDSFRFKFIAGKFQSKSLEESEELKEFIKNKKIDMVICWTDECRNFFKNFEKTQDLGMFWVVQIENPK